MKVFRRDDRLPNELRPWKITAGALDHAEGSALIEAGKTRVICAATVEEKVPSFLKDRGQGWVTAEYSMLPRATHTRSSRERGGRIGGRTMEIQRLIGRSLRSVTDLTALGERTVTVDCDVIQADGGTRTASITGAFVAMTYALNSLAEKKAFAQFPITDFLAATSVGILKNNLTVLDLNYSEDSNAQVDMNIVMTGNGEFVELQGTGEEATFSGRQLQELLEIGQKGLNAMFEYQKKALGQEITAKIEAGRKK